MEKKWNILAVDVAASESLHRELGIHPALCNILSQRGIKTYGEAKKFFNPSLDDLHDPWLMKDMRAAVDRLMLAFRQREKIMVFGDYDVDGTTAVASMYSFLKNIYPNVEFYIPHRYREGYGVSKLGIDTAIENGVTLIISLDCGIKSVDLISYAGKAGVDFIVCDHHLPEDELPPAIAILNPKQKECNYPYKDLCGCGVGFKFMTAVCETMSLEPAVAYQYLDLLATAIAADIVPMTGENRILAWHGLAKANQNPNPGIKALSQLSGLVKELTITNLVFMIAPRVNAAGRMDDARKAVELFIASTNEQALYYAEQLHSDNTERKEADKSITEEALSIITANEHWIQRKSTVVYQPHWHKGVVGIVASRIIEHHYRPTVVLTKSGDYVAGSARSVPGFNLYEAIHACREHLLGYGGHFAAAGLTLENEKVDAFREQFEMIVSSSIKPEHLIPAITIDTEIKLRDITPTFHSIINRMEPFGPENMKPVFLTRQVIDTGWSKIVKDQHLRVSVRQGDTVFSGIGFNLASKYALLLLKKPIDIVFTIDTNEWNGNTSLQLRVIDLRLSEDPG